VETLMRFRWLAPSGLAVRSRKQQRCTNVERIFDEDIECSKGGLMQSHLRICLSVANAANFARTGFLRRAFSEKMEAASKGAAILKIGKNKKPKEVNADEWKSAMSPLEYSVTREAGTERPFTGKYDKHFEEGEYSCFCCGAKLFRY
uniref:peptide-methionine (R)-S-oxide reductase n=1 Tax=Parascaris univalens TaxID=6257 RepID=A0A915AT03_PARUN